MPRKALFLLKPLVSAENLRTYVWASLVSQILIVVTGGAVRLTGSGLGCPTWPECEPGSITNVPELGIHGVIEFANRVLTIALLVVSLLTFLTILRLAKPERKGLLWPALALGLGIVVQAVIGGITVLTGLNAWIVGSHFLVSGVLIAIATILVWRFYGEWSYVPSGFDRWVAAITFPVGFIAVVIGIIVTGSGPHAGDAQTPRNGLDANLLVHLHSYPGYLLLCLVLLQTLLLNTNKETPVFAKRMNLTFLGLIALQVLVGLLQAKLGLPVALVAAHMLGASLLMSMLTFQLLITRNLLNRK
jgi:cytochrome c oxidase assembly protein subunit 15